MKTRKCPGNRFRRYDVRMNAGTFGVGILVGAILFTGLSIAIAWTGPASAPPNGNVAAPINTGTTNQVKDGGLSVDALAVFGNAILSGTSRYLNFGTTVGTSGYGIRDNAGTMQLKNSGGSWVNIPTSVAGAETDPQVGTLTSGRWCTSDGVSVNCNTVAPVTTESDPQVGTLTSGRWCTTNGSVITCSKTAPRIETVSVSVDYPSMTGYFYSPTCPSGYVLSACQTHRSDASIQDGSNNRCRCWNASAHYSTCEAQCIRIN